MNAKNTTDMVRRTYPAVALWKRLLLRFGRNFIAFLFVILGLAILVYLFPELRPEVVILIGAILQGFITAIGKYFREENKDLLTP